MPDSTVYFYQESDGEVPVLKWLDGIRDKKAVKKCFTAIHLLKKFGHELRRPHVDYLRDEIYELRISLCGIQYRILYFFYGKNVVVIAHGLVKENRIPQRDIDLCIERKEQYKENPERHTYIEKVNYENR